MLLLSAAQALYKELQYDGMHVGAIHADMSATARNLQVLRASCRVL